MERSYGFGSTARTHLFIQIAMILGGVYLFSRLLVLLMPLVIPVLISFLLAYICNPFVTRLEKRRVPRTLGILILLVLFIQIVMIFVLFVVPLLAHQLDEFVQKVPGYTVAIKAWLIPWIESVFDTTLPNASEVMSAAMDRIGTDLSTIASSAASPLKEVATFAAAGTYFLFSFVATLFLIPFFTFFLLRDFDKLHGVWMRLTPTRHHDWMRDLLHDMNATMSSWLRGQILVMLILGTLYSIGYSLTGITLSLFIGLLTGFMAFIPYVGAFIGFLLALIMAVLDGGGWGPVLGVTAVFGIVQALDAFFITPNVLGKSVGLNPALVVASLMTFGILWGFWGALIAVPFAALLAVLTRHMIKQYQDSDYYRRSES
jgi:predicted PurR-regulated permease PerM